MTLAHIAYLSLRFIYNNLIYVYVCMSHKHTYTHACTHTRVCMCVCMYACVYTYIHTYRGPLCNAPFQLLVKRDIP